jgi:hypothetical protein
VNFKERNKEETTMANKLFEQHETAKGKAERQTADYARSLAELGGKTQTRKDGTPAMENAHHGRNAASGGRKK